MEEKKLLEHRAMFADVNGHDVVRARCDYLGGCAPDIMRCG